MPTFDPIPAYPSLKNSLLLLWMVSSSLHVPNSYRDSCVTTATTGSDWSSTYQSELSVADDLQSISLSVSSVQVLPYPLPSFRLPARRVRQALLAYLQVFNPFIFTQIASFSC